MAANVGAAPGARPDPFAQGREHGHAGQGAALVPFTVCADQKERLLVALLRPLPVSQCGEVKGQQVLITGQRELIKRRSHSVSDGEEEA